MGRSVEFVVMYTNRVKAYHVIRLAKQAYGTCNTKEMRLVEEVFPPGHLVLCDAQIEHVQERDVVAQFKVRLTFDAIGPQPKTPPARYED